MTRPRLLDLFCGAGGASAGYYRAGFDVVGVDVKPQPRYPFRMIQGDALTYLLLEGQRFDAIHASPPCQDHSRANQVHKINHHTAGLLGRTLDLLARQGRPYIVENVDSAAVRAEMLAATGSYTMLCGSMFGLEITRGDTVYQIRRHRLFATSFPVDQLQCAHRGIALDVTGHNMQGREYKERRAAGLPPDHIRHRRRAMGITWMRRDELSEAIPPAFTQHLGAQLHAAAA